MMWNEFTMKQKHIQMIENGRKQTTLRSLKYDLPYERIKIRVPDELTGDICNAEGEYTKEGLIYELEHIFPWGGHKLPKDMWLYFLWMKK